MQRTSTDQECGRIHVDDLLLILLGPAACLEIGSCASDGPTGTTADPCPSTDIPRQADDREAR